MNTRREVAGSDDSEHRAPLSDSDAKEYGPGAQTQDTACCGEPPAPVGTFGTLERGRFPLSEQHFAILSIGAPGIGPAMRRSASCHAGLACHRTSVVTLI